MFDWGAPGKIDEDSRRKFLEQINDDLNTPRGLAVMWELVKSKLPLDVKKATLFEYDRVLGLHLDEWQPPKDEEIVPLKLVELVHRRQQARIEKRWRDADELRAQINVEGWEIEDTPQGPNLKKRSSKS